MTVVCFIDLKYQLEEFRRKKKSLEIVSLLSDTKLHREFVQVGASALKTQVTGN